MPEVPVVTEPVEDVWGAPTGLLFPDWHATAAVTSITVARRARCRHNIPLASKSPPAKPCAPIESDGADAGPENSGGAMEAHLEEELTKHVNNELDKKLNDNFHRPEAYSPGEPLFVTGCSAPTHER